MLTQSRRHFVFRLAGLLFALAVATLAALLTVRAVAAQGSAGPAHDDPVWQASYWDNQELSGPPLVERTEAILHYDWSLGSPDPRIPPDHFSARWTRYLDLAAATYRFTVTSDDGVRILVDDQPILERWYDHARETHSVDVTLAAGHHLLRVEYYENEGTALVEVTWQPLAEPSRGPWRGEYYANRDLAGEPALVRYDDGVDFDWREGGPGAVGFDDFSVRWTRQTWFEAGRYRFTLVVDDGGRLWVNQHLLIDSWRDQSATTYTGELYLASGAAALQVEYYEHASVAMVRLAWDRVDGGATNGTQEDGWRGEYFDNAHLRGYPDKVRYDKRIDFDWGRGAPTSGIDDDHFSVRWTRTLDFKGGRYRFATETDDGVRLFVDDALIIDQWQPMARTRYTHSHKLGAGYHTLRMEYFEDKGSAFAKLTWRRMDEDEVDEAVVTVGNIITCVPPQPEHCAWIKVYRWDAAGEWIDLSPHGFASCTSSGYLKIDGLLVDAETYGSAGHPYRVEQWVDGHLTHSTGNFEAGEVRFLVRPDADTYTPWLCAL